MDHRVLRLHHAVAFALLLLAGGGSARAAVSFVGSAATQVAAGTTSAAALPGATAAGDVVFVFMVCDNSLSLYGIDAGQGYTDIDHANNAVPGRHLAWKVMGSPADTVVNLTGHPSLMSGVLIMVYRGVDGATPLDVATPAAATGDPGDPDSPSITTITDKAWVLSVGLVDDDTLGTITANPTGYTNAAQGQTTPSGPDQGASVVAASKEVSPAGAENPSAWVLSIDDAWRGYSIALRPGAAVGRRRSF